MNNVEVINLDYANKNQECRLVSQHMTQNDLPIGMVSITGGMVNDVPLVCGTTANSSEPDSLFSDPSSLCYEFDPKSKQWELVSSMTFSRLFSTSVVMDYGLAVIGGISQVIWILDTYVKNILYDRNIQILRNTKKDTKWENKRFEGVIFGSCAVRLNSTTGLLIGGGVSHQQGFFPTRKTWFFNLDTDEWKEGPLLGQPRTAGACGVMKNKQFRNQIIVLIAGGQISLDNIVHTTINLDHNVTNSVEILHFSTKDMFWEKGPDLPIAVHSAQMVERDNGVYLIGGISKNSTFDSIYYLSSSGSEMLSNEWKLLNRRLKISRAMHKSILVPDHMIECHDLNTPPMNYSNITNRI